MINIDIIVIKENRKYNGKLTEWIDSLIKYYEIEERLHFGPISFFLNYIDPKEFNNYSDDIKNLFFKKYYLEKLFWCVILIYVTYIFISIIIKI